MTAQLRSEGSSPSSLVGSGSGPLGAYAGRKHGRLPGDESSAPVVGAPEVFMGSLESLSDVLGGRTWRIPWTVQSMGLQRVGHD